MKNILVVGAGFAGAVVSRELAERGYRVLVIDARNHIAGNAYDYVNEHGIRVHKYGPHIWHTNNQEAQDWTSKFTDWSWHRHTVHAQLEDGRHVPLPINATTIEEVFGNELYEFVDAINGWAFSNGLNSEIEPATIEKFLETKRVKLDGPPQNSRELVESSVGKELCEIFFAPYTEKMWGLKLEELPAGVAARIPTRTDYGDGYFPKDRYQGFPTDGYTAMFEKIFDHPNITVSLNTRREDLPQFGLSGNMRFIPGWEDTQFDQVFTSEPLDSLYEFDDGPLPWRSIKCHTYSVPVPSVLIDSVVNFTHSGPHTRVTEWKKFPSHGDNPHWTTLTVEEPCDYVDNTMERYYPVKTSDRNDPYKALYEKYRARAEADGYICIGRCANYQYLDMWMVVAQTLKIVRDFLETENDPV